MTVALLVLFLAYLFAYAGWKGISPLDELKYAFSGGANPTKPAPKSKP
jgi:hypothetical protein